MKKYFKSVCLVACLMLASSISIAKCSCPHTGFQSVAKKVLPAVVNVAATRRLSDVADEGQPALVDEEKDAEKEALFGDLSNKSMKVGSLGSGLIIDPKGYIVTNQHIIGTSENVKVGLTDGTVVPAKVIGRDRNTDLALLKIDVDHDLPYVEFGDSDKIEIGEWTLVAGNPFGLGGTLTAGIVSAKDREISSPRIGFNTNHFIPGFIQTDASINIGNSGGPVVNHEGRVIGVSTLIMAPGGGGNAGIGFAIPSNTVKMVVAQLKTHGKVQRSWLGVRIQRVTKEIARALKLPAVEGGLVTDVASQSPAALAGVRIGDVILSLNEQPLKKTKQLNAMVNAVGIDQEARLVVWRDHQKITLTVKLAKYQDNAELIDLTEKDLLKDLPIIFDKTLGLFLAPLTPPLRQQLNLPPSVEGAFVANVSPDSPADKEGFVPGDVILSLKLQDTKDPGTVTGALKAHRQDRAKDPLLFGIYRDGQTFFIALQEEKKL